MSILFSRIMNPFARQPHHQQAHRGSRLAKLRPGFIDPSVVKTWHWNYIGDFYVVKFRTDSMQVWVNDSEVQLSPSFGNSEGHISFEAGKQRCQIKIALVKSGSTDSKQLPGGKKLEEDDDDGDAGDESDEKAGRRSHSALLASANRSSRHKLVYRLFVEGVSLGLPDSLEALVQRAAGSAVASASKVASTVNRLHHNSDGQKNALLDSSEPADIRRKPRKKNPLKAAPGDPCDTESTAGDLQSLLIM